MMMRTATATPRKGFGVRARLYAAFIAMSALVGLAAGVSIYAFTRIDRALDAIAEGSVPLAIASLDLSRKAERIVAAAPALLSAESEAERQALSTALNDDVAGLDQLLQVLLDRDVGWQPVTSIRRSVGQLDQALDGLDRVVVARIALAGRQSEQLANARAAAAEATQMIEGWTAEASARIRDLEADAAVPGLSAELRAERSAAIIAEQGDYQRLVEIAHDVALLLAAANRSATTRDAGALEEATLKTAWRLDRLVRFVGRLEGSRRTALAPALERLGAAREVTATRRIEIQFEEAGEKSLAENRDLAARFASAVDRLVEMAEEDVAQSNAEALRVQRLASGVLLSVAAVALLGGALVVWLYVQRNVVARLTALSESMRAISEGDLDAAVPAAGTDEIGRMAQALRVFRDTAIEVKASNLREIRDARRRLDDAIESIQEGFALYDVDGRLVIANARYREIMLGDRSAEPPPGATLDDVLNLAARAGRFPAALEDPEAWVARQRERHRETGEASVQELAGDQWQRIGLRRTEQGGVVVVHSDITELTRVSNELRRAKDAAEAANEAKTAFLATMSHEIRTPLNGIIGMSQLLGETELDAEQRDYSATIIQAAGTLLAIINDILDFSKVEAGALELERAPVDLDTLLGEAVELVSSKAMEKDIALISQIEPDCPPAIWGDPVRLKQILLNLLNNAVKFTERGEIFVGAARAPERPDGGLALAFTVRDTGIGIPTDRMDRLFKSFSQVDASTTRRYGGSGLGLAITKRLVELMGGRIGVESAVGEGTTFTFVVPAVPAPIETDGQEQTWITALRGRRALIAEDNATSRRLLSRKLSGWGMDVTAAANAEEALAAFAARGADLCLIDYRMPGVDGLELARRIGARASDHPPALVLCSASTPHGPDFRQRVREAGFTAVLPKPAKSRHMLKALAEALGGEEIVARKPRPSPAPLGPAVEALSILLVDDNAINRKVGTKILKRLGYDCAVASSGEEAVRACVAAPVDVVLMDIEMPDMDGVAATALIRERLPREAHPFVIALTANALEAERERYLRSGMDAYLSKPIDVDALTAALSAAARSRQPANALEQTPEARHG